MGKWFLPQGIGEGFLEDVPFELSFGRGNSWVLGMGKGCGGRYRESLGVSGQLEQGRRR